MRDVTLGPLSATDTYIVYHVTYFEVSRNVILHTRYVSTYVGAGCGRGRGTKKTKAIRCGACYYRIVLNAHRFTSMADTDIDAVRKQRRQNTLNNTD
jgi:DNA-directed RNA polymerase subunit RPC12/RpoP